MSRTESPLPYTFGWVHPEQRPGEVLLGNWFKNGPKDYERIKYQSKRAGSNTYDTDGNIVPDMCPMFVSEAEYKSRHKEATVEIGQ